MKQKIELASNTIVIVVGLLWIFVIGRNYILPTFFGGNQVRAGHRLDGLTGIGWGRYDRPLVLALRLGCRFCEESVPFYKRLVEFQEARNAAGVRIIAAFPDNAVDVRQYMDSVGLQTEAVSGVSLKSLGVAGTPTLILAGRKGQVLRSWAGRLSADGEREVIDAMAAAGAAPPVAAPTRRSEDKTKGK